MDLKNTVIGIELGSTRIKALLIDREHKAVAAGTWEWENILSDGIWTYPMDMVKKGIQSCYRDLKENVREKFNVDITTVGAIGISGMMHGYLPFDKNGKQLTEFRSWRNTITAQAASILTELFDFNIPQRWSIAHLYQAILNKEEHVKDIDFITSLAGYVHFLLSGEKVVGIGEASGIFPIDSSCLDYDREMIDKFDAISAQPWKLRDILPKALPAGTSGGFLTEAGALFLDPSGMLKAGVPLAACEGDAGSGMTACNAVIEGSGNVSVGTSDFAMIVTGHPLKVHRQIDMVTTPEGLPVAMVHCNNCTSDINAWAEIFGEFADMAGMPVDREKLYSMLFKEALAGDPDCGGLLSYNYFSGEGVTDIDEGRPVFLRHPNSKFNLANFMRMHLMSALATLKIGMDILTKEENVRINKIYGHGGFFKTAEIGQKILSAAINAPVSCMISAAEGGPYGMALLGAYMLWKEEGESLADYLENKVFASVRFTTLMADAEEVEGFNKFTERYKKIFDIERMAVNLLKI